MKSPPAYFALSFVLAVLFFSQGYTGSRVRRLECLEEGVASAWFACELFFVCDRVGVSPLLEKCNWLETYDLGSRRCLPLRNPDEETVEKGFRSFPCKPWPGTNEKYWLTMLKVLKPPSEAETDSKWLWIWT
ncbi:uncharacterized protein LOC124612302 [Schistocerca americana]|uniref:uncharacterized protein LOC124612302 n=1 Tax=Schistocerca americana TaxID=7009 RepID=UPI001F5008ED|nr:uncharacterized protein LOC124612302 [Schistocerca americana]